MSSRHGKIVEEFQASLGDGKFDFRVLSPKSADVGTTMTVATNIIHLWRWWNPAVEEQCNDRICRIGQKRGVTIHIPMSPETDSPSEACVNQPFLASEIRRL